MKSILLMLFLTCLISCGKSKEIKLFDETKTSLEDTALVIIPNDVDVLRIDNKAFSNPFTNNNLELTMAAGSHSFVIRYYCMWKTPNGDYSLLKSQKIELSLKIEKNKTYQLSHRKLNDYDSALAFEKEPAFHFNRLSKDSKIADFIMPSHAIEEAESSQEDKKAEINSTKEKTNYLDALKFMYKNSSEEDQKEFLKWLENQKK